MRNEIAGFAFGMAAGVGIVLALHNARSPETDRTRAIAGVSLHDDSKEAALLEIRDKPTVVGQTRVPDTDLNTDDPPSALSDRDRGESARLFAWIERPDISRLEMRFADEWLKVALKDPAAREALERWFLGQAAAKPADLAFLRETVRTLDRVNRDALVSILDEALVGQNWTALAAVLAEAPGCALQQPAADGLLTAALVSGNTSAEFYALRALGDAGRGDDFTEASKAVEALFATGATDPSVEATAAFTLNVQGKLDGVELYDVLADRFTSNSDPARRYGALVHMQLALFQEKTSDKSYYIILDRLYTALDWLRASLDDPDPIVQLSARVNYLLISDGLDELSRGLYMSQR